MPVAVKEPWFVGLEERGRRKKRVEEGEQKGEAEQAEGGGKPRPKAKPTGSFKPGHPHYPRRPAPPRELVLKRRAIVSQLLAQGMPDRDIVSVCLDPERALDFGQAWRVHRLLAEIKDQWAHDDAEQAPRLKAMAVRRLLGSIQSARADKAWTAVASLERTLADIQGTREPVRIEVDVTADMVPVRSSLNTVVGGNSGVSSSIQCLVRNALPHSR